MTAVTALTERRYRKEPSNELPLPASPLAAGATRAALLLGARTPHRPRCGDLAEDRPRLGRGLRRLTGRQAHHGREPPADLALVRSGAVPRRPRPPAVGRDRGAGVRPVARGDHRPGPVTLHARAGCQALAP